MGKTETRKGESIRERYNKSIETDFAMGFFRWYVHGADKVPDYYIKNLIEQYREVRKKATTKNDGDGKD